MEYVVRVLLLQQGFLGARVGVQVGNTGCGVQMAFTTAMTIALHWPCVHFFFPSRY